ncbi:putative phospholipid-transporting ATPase 8 [Canna indica]|uniref:Phospholipid-transporting ATPase n=1 Tax=Canna indica TaxID=4628 RepID=A0AAQ3JM44_9LILI|nr:putative phospholipid-transporting ATPase 8 [Canna indica]
MAGDGRPRSVHRLFEMAPLFRRGSRRSPAELINAGYSRTVYCNNPACPEALDLNYPDNSISTTKYTVANFVPKSIFEQFRRVANFFFLMVACISFSPLAPYRAVSILLPLVLVVGATMAKEAVEDWQRKKQDIEVNNRKVNVYDGAHFFYQTEWKKLRVGDIIMVEKDEFFPADLLLLSTSYDDGICYVETMNLDGETNLKRKQSLEVTSILHNEHSFQKFEAFIKCEDPNEKLYSFVGVMNYEGVQYPLTPKQILLRDSKLRNTQKIYGVVIFTGHDTKVMQNAMDPPSKRSNIERRMDKIIYVLFTLLVFISSISSVFFGINTRNETDAGKYMWYLRPDKPSIYFDPKKASLAAFFHFLTDLMLYGCLIPISLYISIEIVKVLQSLFIDHDQEMYCKESDKPARARTSNLNEELGQVNTILSDKTGTLTCNSMEFVKCSIAGFDYGSKSFELEKTLTKGRQYELSELHSLSFASERQNYESRKPPKGFSFVDDRLMNGQWIQEPNADLIQFFFHALAICHTAIPVVSQSGEISYEAESPDEAAFVTAAREFGFEFYRRTETSISLHEFDPKAGRKVDRTYELLNTIEFSSARKRMSVIVKTNENQLLLFCKGADSVIFERLAKQGQLFEHNTKCHINEYSESGLRTLAVAYRVLSAEEYITWHDGFLKAKNSVNAEHDAIVDEAADRIERELILLGATAVEDKLQKGVPECINKLAQAGIKIWILTGDKLETAINIGFACQLLRKGMELLVITLDNQDINDMKKNGDRDALEKTLHESIRNQIHEAQSQVSKMKGSNVLFALIIDGDSLAFALSSSLEHSFLDLSVDCASVICCRTSPKQKALVTRLVKRRTRKTTLAIGDGANDVGMLQEADIGVGISGVEGMQAVMSSDFAIAQFRFLERLLLVHGHWCYRRISAMICYFFYKNITFGFTLFWFETHAYFSGQPAYNDWYIAFYSVGFTSLPVIALGVFDKDISSRLCLKFPKLHQDGIQNIFFSWPRILGWMINGVCSSLIIYYFTTRIIFEQAFRQDGHVAGYDILGVTMYTCVVWTVNCQLAIYLSYFTWIQHFVIWGSIIFWYIFLVIYGFFPPNISTTAYRVFLEACAASPLYWLATLLVVISALVPYFSYSNFQKTLFPKYHNLIQRLQVKRER